MIRTLNSILIIVTVTILSACVGTGETVVVTVPDSTSSTSSSSGGQSSSSSSSSSGSMGGYTDNTHTEESTSIVQSYENLFSLGTEEQPLQRLSSDQTASLVRNALRRKILSSYPSAPVGSQSSSSGQLLASGQAIETISDARSIVVGSDNSEQRVHPTVEEFDGTHWFVSSVSANRKDLNLDVLALDPTNAGIQHLVDFNIVGGSAFSFDGVKGLSAIKNNVGETTKLALLAQTPPLPFAPSDRNYINRKLDLYFVGVENLQTPENIQTIALRGDVLTTHRVDNTLYIISRVEPYLDGLSYSGEVLSDAVIANENAIGSASMSAMLPGFENDESCLAPTTTVNTEAGSLLRIVAVDLVAEQVSFSDCISAVTRGIYLQGSDLYTWTSSTEASESKTLIHKFGLSVNALSYKAWGVVDGTIEHASYLPHGQVDMYQDNMRLITTAGSNDHRLHILSENTDNGRLEVIGRIPGEQDFATIQADGDLFGAQFHEEKIFLSTLSGTNYGFSSANPPGPTYVIDTSDVTNPVVTQQLQLLDYASNINALGDRFLLTVARTGINNYDTQIDLVDTVSASVVESASFSAPSGASGSGGPLANSPGSYNAGAVVVQEQALGDFRISVPIDFVDRDINGVVSRSALILLEVSGLPDQPVMTVVGEVDSHTSPCNNDFPGYGCIYGYLRGLRKSMIIDESVFYLYEGTDDIGETGVSSVSWGDFSEVADTVTFGLVL